MTPALQTMRPYLFGMDDTIICTVLVAQEAAEALVALGWPVLPHGPDMEVWRIGDFVLTDDELIGLATRRGISPAVEKLQ